MRSAAESTAIPVGRLKHAFATLEAADGPLEFPVGIKNKNLSRFRIGNVEIVLRIQGDALRRAHRILVFIPALNEFVLVPFQIEDVNPVRAGVGDDGSAARVHGDAVWPDQMRMLRLANDYIHEAC